MRMLPIFSVPASHNVIILGNRWHDPVSGNVIARRGELLPLSVVLQMWLIESNNTAKLLILTGEPLNDLL